MCNVRCEIGSVGRVGLRWQLLPFGSAAAVLLMLLLGQTRAQSDINGFNFHIYDMFEPMLMPMQILSQRQLEELFRHDNASATPPATATPGWVHGSDFYAALSSMEYHRRMMNEFLASDYIAQQILREGAEWTGNDQQQQQQEQQQSADEIFPIKRMGEAKADNKAEAKHANASSSSPAATAHANANSNHKLLNDEGMTRYMRWLKKHALLNALPSTPQPNGGKSATLRDIQKQLEKKKRQRRPPQHRHRAHGHTGLPQVRRQTLVPSEQIDLSADYSDEEPDFEDGDVTGYAMSSDYANPQYSASNHQHWPFMATATAGEQQAAALPAKAISKNGYESGYEDYSSGVYHAPPQHAPNSDAQHAPATASKEISLKDITDIALTTLAFLSFGMFILQVLMCITMSKDDTSNLMMLPMESAETSEQDGVEEVRRKRRSAPDVSRRLVMMNELARRVLFSIDAALLLPKDDGACTYWSLCENNRFSKKQNNGQRYWIPIWSLGMSWFTSRIQTAKQAKNADYLTILYSLKAIITGLATDNCEKVYRNACDKM